MARILETVFVIGCSVVGFSLSTADGNCLKQTMKCSVQLVALAQSNVAANTARLTANLARVPVKALWNLQVK